MSQPMMTVAIDPSETRSSTPPVARPPRLRLVLLSGLGVLGLAGFTALASSVLGGMAGPQVARASIRTATLTQKASDWPDLRDGIPALAPLRTPPDRAASEVAPAETPMANAAPVAVPRAVPVAPSPASPPVAQTSKRVEAAPAPKPARLPPIENVAVLPPARPAALVPATRTAALVAPSAAETTRSRATNDAVTAAPPEREAPKRKPAAAIVAPKAKPATPKVAAAAAPVPQPQAAEPEAEHTEVFGLKVPSLAPAGRKLVEGVEALGNAVKNLPDRF